MYSEEYWEGYRAYVEESRNGVPADNPYEQNSYQYDDWREGYYAAAWDD